ncbi:hypothetical protein [Hydrogenophaga sp.]|uniref:hypothetical protein n=1 Tax=Hydrogenophaga sp. TaxID=1904254 RepID=UPI003D0FBC4F
MNNMNVIALPASTNFTPEQALNSALSHDLADVLVIGYDQDGELVIRSSRMTCAEAAFLCEKAKNWALTGGQL